MPHLNWLHLSDLHIGMSAQKWLWPKFENDFLSDLSRLHDKSGPWHMLLFTGDMVRAGSSDEFERFDEVLGRLYETLRALGSEPKLITVPGNHDLVRPSNLDPKAVALGQFSERTDLQEDFWGPDNAGYRSFVNSLFDNYHAWRARSVKAGVHLEPVKEGLLVGDAAYSYEANGIATRVITLNSTWMQFTDRDHRGRLVLHPIQFTTAAPQMADNWLDDCDLPVIATHQPLDWLTQESQADWLAEIYPASRFLLHAFGHMHTPNTKTSSQGGGGTRREFQAASLFGLERTGSGLERIQGYSANRLVCNDEGIAIQVWPRRLTPVANGERKLKADPLQDLDEDNSYTIPIRRPTSANRSDAVARQSLGAPLIESVHPTNNGTPSFDLANIAVALPQDAAHEAVRGAEQQEALEAWADKPHGFWLVSDWGLGEEEFLGGLRAAAGLKNARCFRLSLDQFRTKADFLESIRAAHGVTFEDICNRIDEEGDAILVFSDAPFRSPLTQQDLAIATEIEGLIYATADYLEGGRFALITRAAPISHSLPVVELKPLDEPDLAAYVAVRRPADLSLNLTGMLSRLHRATDGHPGRLDAALKTLEVVALSELVKSDPDLEPAQPAAEVPAAVPAMIIGLRNEGDGGTRSFELLQSLSLFPGGERLDRLKRLDNSKPFFSVHATMLLDRRLIDTMTYAHFGDGANANNAPLLIVPRPVREYVNSIMTDQQRERLDRLAVELYFGQNWRSGLAKSAMAHRIARKPVAPPHELHNCNTVLLRTLMRAKETDNELNLEAAIRVGIAFLERQISGGHYRSALALAEDLAPALADGNNAARASVDIARAKCLRMTGHIREARDAYLAIDASPLPKKTQQEIFLGLAHTYGSDGAERRAAAEKVIKLGAGSSSALQAKAIIVQMEPPGSTRDAKLDRLLHKAKSTKSYVVENNIKLFRAELLEGAERITVLRNVIDSSRSTGDFYNAFRAIIRLLEQRGSKERVKDADKILLITGYRFFHNERIDSLFNRAHDLLWKIFEDEGDLWNLLGLFRHSSFIWRLAGKIDAERGYLEALKPRQDNIAKSNLPNLNRERRYFLARLQSAAAG